MQGGLTDGPPSTYSGLQLLRWWHENGRKAEVDAPDGSFLLCLGRLDFDYLMGYLLEVRTGRMSDYLMCFVRHAGTGRGDLVAEWAQRSHDVFGDDHPRVEVTHRWVDWVDSEIERYSDEIRSRPR